MVLVFEDPQVEGGDDQVRQGEPLYYAPDLDLLQVNLANGTLADADDEQDEGALEEIGDLNTRERNVFQ